MLVAHAGAGALWMRAQMLCGCVCTTGVAALWIRAWVLCGCVCTAVVGAGARLIRVGTCVRVRCGCVCMRMHAVDVHGCSVDAVAHAHAAVLRPQLSCRCKHVVVVGVYVTDVGVL